MSSNFLRAIAEMIGAADETLHVFPNARRTARICPASAPQLKTFIFVKQKCIFNSFRLT